ncbi:helix-turn-helix domain-containing protein [Paenibacillus senegalimassiliensis]|uniref:helix-turn-helix domain-containing protein n=1 Tax=Paenibacillus senegalimassiliensis TaxID=1737426 RepID=UPI00073F4023|nr:helix-turn-helix transcriptional regulator [Paenibacillus senegalimassiliensis]
MYFTRGRSLLKVRLKDRGIKQIELAHRTGISRQMISQYANNRSSMSVEVMKTISYVLGCHMEELYQWERHNKE